jgi:hypothetical protein
MTLKLGRQACVDAFAVVGHRARLAVHLALGAHDAAAERARCSGGRGNAQDRHLADERLDGRHADAGLAGEQGPGERRGGSGASAATPSSVISSLRATRTSSPSSPKYWTRL